MRIGSLVTLDTIEEYGVVIDERWRAYKVHWITGMCSWHDEIYLMEVWACE